ncbi:MAG: phosphatidate cytidylyltransferase [Flavobacteriales bacterium]|jgi:phosphatidate cytidylyltransferase|nr:phosphatidate cytidylyltransferase [Flavobacteriales bacterium]
MNNFQKRLLSGAVYIIVLTLGCTLNENTAHSLFVLLMLLSLYEFKTIAQKFLSVHHSFTYIISLMFYLSINPKAFPILEFSANAWLFASIIVYLSWIFYLIQYKTESYKYIVSDLFSYVYIVLPFALAVPFAKTGTTDFVGYKILLLFVFIWSSDSFAYVFGSKFGKNKLFPSVSPKKSWEGFIGGGLSTLILGYLAGYFFEFVTIPEALLYAFLAFFFGSIGDLIQSSLKRHFEIKDSSNLIPGHGGFLDRLDSFIFAMPIVYILNLAL